MGEAFDKVASAAGARRIPGGRPSPPPRPGAIRRRWRFRARWLGEPGLDFSFSGLKTAVALEVERRGAGQALGRPRSPTCAASFEAAAVDVLVERARRAVANESAERLAVVGGVAANRRLREHGMQAAAARTASRSSFRRRALCTDNAAMIAAAGFALLRAGERHGSVPRLLLAGSDR